VISTGDLKRGISFEIDGDLFRVLDFNHIKMGRGSAQVRMKLRNLRTGAITEKTVQAGELFPRARLDSHTVQFQYADGDSYNFMNTETFDQISIPESLIKDDIKFLKERLDRIMKLITVEYKIGQDVVKGPKGLSIVIEKK